MGWDGGGVVVGDVLAWQAWQMGIVARFSREEADKARERGDENAAELEHQAVLAESNAWRRQEALAARDREQATA